MWYLLDQEFEIAVGMTLQVKAAPSLAASDPYLHAIEMTNLKLGTSIVLRSAADFPLWQIARGNRQQKAIPPRSGMGCVFDRASVLDNDFELAAGDELTVVYAVAACADEYIGLQVIDAAGKNLILRTTTAVRRGGRPLRYDAMQGGGPPPP